MSLLNKKPNKADFSNLTTIGAIAGGIKGATESLPSTINEQGMPIGASFPSRLGNIAINAGLGAGAGYVGTGLLKNAKAGKYAHIIDPLKAKAQPFIDKLPSVDIEIIKKTNPIVDKQLVNDLSGVNIPRF